MLGLVILLHKSFGYVLYSPQYNSKDTVISDTGCNQTGDQVAITISCSKGWLMIINYLHSGVVLGNLCTARYLERYFCPSTMVSTVLCCFFVMFFFFYLEQLWSYLQVLQHYFSFRIN